jgi:hypothetical protein
MIFDCVRGQVQLCAGRLGGCLSEHQQGAGTGNPNTGGGAGSVIYLIEAGMRHVIGVRCLGRADAQRIEVRQNIADSFSAADCPGHAASLPAGKSRVDDVHFRTRSPRLAGPAASRAQTERGRHDDLGTVPSA